jgi:3-hydroxybutyryl-CoA dehydratase
MSGTKAHLRLGQGKYWDELSVGETFRTFRRTIREADLVNFISVTGMLEEIFIDATPSGAMSAGAVPGALTYSLIEGMQMQTLIQGTGLALLEMSMKMHAAVHVGDTIWAEVNVTGVRPTSKGGRGVVDTDVRIINQKDELVVSYSVRRLIAGQGLETEGN